MADIVIASGSSANMVDRPLWLKATGGDPAISYSAQDDRALLDVFAFEGVVSETALQVTQRAAGANLTLDVAAGKAVIQGDSITRQGKYMTEAIGVVNTASNVTVPGSGTRTHRVILRLRDKAAAGSDYDWTIEVLEDTGSGAPAIPASAISLATVAVPAGASSVTDAMITDTRPFARAPRGFIGGTNYPGTANIVATVGTTETYLGMISPVVRVRAGWLYSVRALISVTFSASATSGLFRLRVDDGGTHLTGAEVGQFLSPPGGSSGGHGYPFDFSRTWAPAADASLRIALTGSRYNGYGSGTLNVTRRNELATPLIEVHEVGPASLYTTA